MDGDPACARSSGPHQDHTHNGCSKRDWTDLRVLLFILHADAERDRSILVKTFKS